MKKNMTFRHSLFTSVLFIILCFMTSDLSAKSNEPVDLIKNIYSTKRTKKKIQLPKKLKVPVKKEVGKIKPLLVPKKPILDISVEQNIEKTTIHFPWRENVKAAAFQRNNNLWVIFNKDIDINYTIFNAAKDINLIRHAAVKNISKINTNSNGVSTVLVFELANLDQDSFFRVYKNENKWNIEISNKILKFKDIHRINLHSHPFEKPSPRVELITEESDLNPISFVDPYVGDTISVVPLSQAQKSVPYDYNFIDFDILKTIQGAAIQKKADNLSIKTDNYFVIISSKDGLNISSKFGATSSFSLFQRPGFTKYKEFKSNGILGLKPYLMHTRRFQKFEKRLKSKIIHSLPNQEYNARVNIAMLYLANRFYKEAKDNLNLATIDYKLLKRNYAVLLLKAVNEFMSRNYEKSYNHISKIDESQVPVKNLEEVRLWKAVITMKSDDADKSSFDHINQYFERNADFMKMYTHAFIKEIKFTSAEYYINKGYLTTAEKIINSLSFYDMSKEESSRFYYIVGNFYKKTDEIKQAINSFDKCAKHESLVYYYSLCNMEKINLQLQKDQISKSHAIYNLKYLDLLVRNTDLDMVLMKKIADIYYEMKDYVQALRMWSTIVRYYPYHLDTLRISNDMSKLFIDIFIGQKQDQYTPLQKVLIFDEFDNLNPVGEIGDKIALKLVDFFVDLGLLERASKLLEHQVKYRLYGLQKEKYINKLGQLYLELNDPKQALSVLNDGADYKLLTKELTKERKYLRANILEKMHEYNEVVELLNGDLSEKADNIRAAIYWSQQDWNNFNDNSEPYIYSIRSQNHELTDSETKKVLKQAISYAYLGKHNLLNDLYIDFNHRFSKNQKYKEIIELFNNILADQTKGPQSLRYNNNLKQTLDKLYSLIK